MPHASSPTKNCRRSCDTTSSVEQEHHSNDVFGRTLGAACDGGAITAEGGVAGDLTVAFILPTWVVMKKDNAGAPCEKSGK